MSKKKQKANSQDLQPVVMRRLESVENQLGKFLSQEADTYLRTLSESSKETTNSIKYCLETAQTLEALSKRLEEIMAGLELQVEEIEELIKTEKVVDKNLQNLKKCTSSLSRAITRLERKKPSFLERVKSTISKIL